LALDIYKCNIRISDKIVIRKDNKSKVLYLRGIIYFGGFHFTSCIISLDQMVWYYDGMTSGARPIQEGFLDQIENLNVSNERDATVLIYAQK